MKEEEVHQKMDEFIYRQINSFGNKKFSKEHLIQKYIKYDCYMVIEIKNNNIHVIDPYINKDMHGRKLCFINLLKYILTKYELPNTVLIFYVHDGYSYNNEPVFNYALPDGVAGLIYPDFSMFDCTTETYDDKINNIKNYRVNSERIIPKIYFKGMTNSEKRNQIRELMYKMQVPEFEIKLGNSYPFEPQKYMKKYKFLFDLAGTKPWSVRFKFLMATSRLVIRISFYNPNRRVYYENNRIGVLHETSYFKQYADFLFTENVDYVHLVYKLDYDHKIPNNKFKEIINDIKTQYEFYNENDEQYKKMVYSMNKKNKHNTLDNACLYFVKLIYAYDNLLLKK